MNTAEDITDVTMDKPSKPKGIPIEDMLKYRDRNLSHADIGKMLGCSSANVTNRLKGYKKITDRVDTFKQHRADALTHLQIKVLDHLTDDKLKDSSATQLITGMAILYDKERLERGQSTANMSVAGLVEAHSTNLEAITDDIARLSQELDSE